MSNGSITPHSSESRTWLRFTHRYGVALAAVVVAVGTRALLVPQVGEVSPFVLDYPAVLIAAWYGGLGPGLVATLLASVSTAWLLLPPTQSMLVERSADQLSLATFFLNGVLISALNQELHRRRTHAEADAAALREKQLQLAQEQTRKAAMLDSVSDAIIGLDGGARIQEWNARAEEIFGYRREEVVGRDVLELLIPEGDRERHRRWLGRILTAGESRLPGGPQFVRTVRADGREMPVEVTLAVLEVEGAPFLEAFIRDLTEKQDAETALRESRNLFREFMDHSPALAFVRDTGGRIVYVNAAYEQFFRAPSANLLGASLSDVVPQATVDMLRPLYQRVVDEGRAIQADATIPDPGGAAHEFVFYLFPIHREGERPYLGGMAVNVSEQRLLERQLRQAQKLEAIGQLAGGVAHDFNNILAVVNGYSEMLLMRSDLHSLVRDQLAEILRAGDRASRLTRQLLTFSRQQVVAPRVLDLNEVIRDISKMLGRLIGEDVALSLLLAEELDPILADPGQVEQVILNLAVNARDAMPTGGQLTIETANVVLDSTYSQQHAGLAEGPYAMLAVSDTGQGMSREVQERIFEPFFTTKEQGKGTGLGLATVFGIVKQSNGHVNVYSEPDVGSTFRVYLPRVEEVVPCGTAQTSPHSELTGNETILVAEDDSQLRTLIRELLGSWGYRALMAACPSEALGLSETHPSGIDLLLTDVVMPEMGGRELAERVRARRPQTRIVFMSGYTDDAVVRNGVLVAGVDFIQKPFAPTVLGRKIREVLDRRAPTPR